MSIDWATFDWATFGVDLHLELDGRDDGGRRAGLERVLREAVRGGRLTPATRLPSTRALAAELGLSRGTVTAAYDQLIAEGWLTARTGSGTVVAALPRDSDARPSPLTTAAPPRFDLRPGSPDPSSFPVAGWLRTARRALADAPASAYGYGDPRGRPELRAALAGYLGRARGVRTDPDRIVVTSGAVQALALLVSALAATGDRPVVAMEDPGLPLHREVVRRAGATVLALPVDELGARTDRLSTQDGVRAAVLTPAHQYPTGVTLHPTRRRAALAWARDQDGLIVEDDYDGEFRYDRQPVGALQGTAPDRVAYLGTAAKTLAPALRLAWLALPAALVEPVVDAKLHADLHSETIGQLTLARFITEHAYDRHIRAGRLRYRRRRDALLTRLNAITATRPTELRARDTAVGRPGDTAGGRSGGFSVHGIAAGLHALIRLPDGGPDEATLLARAADRGLLLGGLAGNWHVPGGHPQGLVVGYGTPSESAYPAALDALATLLAAHSTP